MYPIRARAYKAGCGHTGLTTHADTAKWRSPHAKAVAEVPEPTLGDAMTGMQEAASTFFGTCENMGLNLSGAETPEQPAAVHDDTSDAVRFQIMTIRGEFGEYRISDDDFIYTGAFGDVKGVAEDLGAWLEELKRAAHMLEVEA